MDPAFFWIHTSFVASKLDAVAPPIPDTPSAFAVLIIPDALETWTLFWFLCLNYRSSGWLWSWRTYSILSYVELDFGLFLGSWTFLTAIDVIIAYLRHCFLSRIRIHPYYALGLWTNGGNAMKTTGSLDSFNPTTLQICSSFIAMVYQLFFGSTNGWIWNSESHMSLPFHCIRNLNLPHLLWSNRRTIQTIKP